MSMASSMKSLLVALAMMLCRTAVAGQQVPAPILIELLLDRHNICLSHEYGAMPCDSVAGYFRDTLKLSPDYTFCVYIAGAKSPDPRVQKVADSLQKAGYQANNCYLDYGSGVRPPS